jgi:UDP-glucose 4-epimerase
MAVLVTGGAGYIGVHTVFTLLESGLDVVVLDNLSNGHSKSVDICNDLTKKRALLIQADLASP